MSHFYPYFGLFLDYFINFYIASFNTGILLLTQIFNQYQFILNFFRELYTEENIPKHSCLQLVANSEQVLSAYVSRRLLTYEKTSCPNGPEVSYLPMKRMLPFYMLF